MKKKLLYITDQFRNSNHSSIEAIFDGYLKEYFDITLLYFDKTTDTQKQTENRIYFPYKKRKEISKKTDLQRYDIIIVRNRFDILKQLLFLKRDFKLGFQLSFPHSFRRYYQAKMEKKALFRKKIEYEIKDYMEKKYIKRCDFFLPISSTMYKLFYYDLKVPCFTLPLGIDPKSILKKERRDDEKIRFVYTGSIDRLREFDVVLKAFCKVKRDDFTLDIFTPHFEYAKSLMDELPNEMKSKIRLSKSLPRDELLKKLPSFDVGIFLIPESLLYAVSSPTKVMEYYQCQIPSLMSKIPECLELFADEEEGWICDFDENEIEKKVKKILTLTKEEIAKMGIKGEEVLSQKRNYKTISKEFYSFIGKIWMSI